MSIIWDAIALGVFGFFAYSLISFLLTARKACWEVVKCCQEIIRVCHKIEVETEDE